MPHLIQFHFPNFFPDFGFRQTFGYLAHPLVSADTGDAKQFAQPAKAGLAEAVKQDCQSLGRFRAAPLGGGCKMKTTGFAAVALEAPYKTMFNI